MRCRPSFILVLGAVLPLAACVTVKQTPSHGLRVPTAKQPQASGPRTVAPPANPVPLPPGPVAAPATASTTFASRVAVQVAPLGQVAYDGQALPLVSPDGRFIAVQEGDPPSWEAILAEPAAEAPLHTTIALYEVGPRELKRLAPPQALPAGVILGRASDDKGALVEWLRADGSRWIGRLPWVGGGVQWLVEGKEVNCHATFTPRGELVFTRRAIEQDVMSLVLRTEGGAEDVRAPAEGTYAFPMCVSDPDTLYILRLLKTGTELEAIRIERPGDGRVALGGSLLSRAMTPGTTVVGAYQLAVTTQPVLPHRGEGAGGSPNLAIYNPRVGKMAEFRLDAGAFDPLATKSIAAAPSRDPNRAGYFCTTPGGLVFAATGKATTAEGPPTVRVVSSPYVPRPIEGQAEMMMLFGPVKDRPDRLDVVRMIVGEGQEAPPPGRT